ncbi:MAG: purine-nucleoside phosphorylase [Clostridia bacterium]|nr:purine-nucleoside phosphorylase [Clostridia bacterium]
MSEYTERIQKAAQALRERVPFIPKVGMVLGSGWNILIENIENPIRVPYGEVPGMKVSTVPGHAGEWVFGTIGEQKVAVMNGRLHMYEGWDPKDVTFPVRVMKALGIEVLILTNAAGAVNKSFQPGDLMMITDHLNLAGRNPLWGPNEDELGPRFPDMSHPYDGELMNLAREASRQLSFPIREGVYALLPGPCFETPAEIRMVRTLGADAVGMSTIPEVIAANHGGMRVLALSCMTNMAAGILDQPLSHQEVLDTANRVKEPYRLFMKTLVQMI